MPAAARAVAQEAKASATGPLIVLETLGRPAWTPRDYEAFAREGFMQNAIVYRAVRMIAEAAASVPLLLYEGDDEHERHPLLDLLARPSLDHTGTDFLEAWYGYLLVAGNAYVEAVALDGRLRELHALRPDRMKVVPGAEGWPEAYEYTCAGRTIRFEEEPVPGVRPILHVRLFHPANDHYGMSPVEAAAQAIDIHNTAGRWNKALLDNSARPSGALVYGGADGRMTPEQFERLKAELEDGFQGPRRAGRPLLLEGGLDWKPLSLSPKDMDFIEARNGAAREIALAFGVPPMLLGIPGDNTYSNYQEAQRAFWRSTVLHLVTRTARALASWLAPTYGSNVDLKPDLDQIEALTSEREALWARIEKVSFLTLNEKRAAVGYAPIEEPAPPTTPENASSIVARKYRPDQARAPSGTSDGGEWVDEGGGSGRPSSGSIASGVGAPARDDGAREERVRVAQIGEEPSYKIDVHEHEGRNGGHTIAEHVGRSDAYILARARGERGPTAVRRRVGSFPTVEAANKLVSATLSSNKIQLGETLSNRELVARVARGEKNGEFLTLEFSSKTGREAYAASMISEPYLRDTYGVGVLIVRDKKEPAGFTVVVAYPRNP
jgi:HK97 family phage portal protein